MAAMTAAVAVAVALIGSLTSKKKPSKKSLQQQQLPLPVVGALSAGFALYFGWKHCRTRCYPPLPKKNIPNNSQNTQTEEVEEAEIEVDEWLSSHEDQNCDQNISQVFKWEPINDHEEKEQYAQSQWITASQCSTSLVLNNNEESMDGTLSSEREAMQRPLKILGEEETGDLLGDTLPTSPSISPPPSFYCYSSSPRNECKEERALRPVDGRLHAYEEYLSDPCLSPRMRAQVLKAKSIVERVYRSREQSSISQENSIESADQF